MVLDLQSALDDLYSSNCPPSKVLAAQEYLTNAQDHITENDIVACLQSTSSHRLRFAFQTICCRPSAFCNSFDNLFGWYVYTNCETGLLSSCASALASLILVSPSSEQVTTVFTALFNKQPSKAFILLEPVSFGICKLKNDAAHMCRLSSTRTIIQNILSDNLHAINHESFKFAITGLRLFFSAFSKFNPEPLFEILLQSRHTETSSLEGLLCLLDDCTLNHSLKTTFAWICRFAYQYNEANLTIPILSIIQEHLDTFIMLPEREIFCFSMINRLQSDDFENSISFWEDMATELADSEQISEFDKNMYKRLLDMALNLNISKPDLTPLLEGTYKVLGSELPEYVSQQYINTMDKKYLDIYIMIGNEYIGSLDTLQSVINHSINVDLKRSLELMVSFYNTIRRNPALAASVCKFASESLYSLDLSDLSVECLVKYSSFADDNIVKAVVSFIRHSTNEHAMIKVIEFCALACAHIQNIELNNSIVELCVKSRYSHQLLAILFKDLQFQFVPRDCHSLINQITHDIHSYPQTGGVIEDSKFSFLRNSCSIISKIDQMTCLSLLNHFPRNSHVSYISIFALVEQTFHIPDIIDRMFNHLKNVSEEVVDLHAAICNSKFECYMEYGTENIIPFISSCICKLNDAISLSELRSIMTYLTLLFIVDRADNEMNWRNYLLENVLQQFFDGLLTASHKYDRDRRQFIALFMFSLIEKHPLPFKIYLESSIYKTNLSWMLKERSMKIFIDSFHDLFK